MSMTYKHAAFAKSGYGRTLLANTAGKVTIETAPACSCAECQPLVNASGNGKAKGPNPLKLDPTRTGMLRKRFEKEWNRRLEALRKSLWQLVVEEDALGLTVESVRNVYCKTGKGGGKDPTCSKGSGKSKGEKKPRQRKPVEMVRVFHGTSNDLVNSILKEGLLMKTPSLEHYPDMESQPTGVYISTDGRIAASWGEETAYLAGGKEKGVTFVVFEAEIPKEWMEPDYGVIGLDAYRVKQDIPPSMLKRVLFARDPKGRNRAMRWWTVKRGKLVENLAGYVKIYVAIVADGEPVDNAWCPTGPGGGKDNSCPPRSGGVKVMDVTDFGRGDADDEYLYHVTPSAGKIVESGRLQQGRQTMGQGFYRSYSQGKVFLTERSAVRFWVDRIEEHLESQYDDPPPLQVVRIPKSKLKGKTKDDEVGTRDATGRKSYYLDEPLDLTDNAWCPTGEGGGKDNSCPPKRGGSGKEQEHGQPARGTGADQAGDGELDAPPIRADGRIELTHWSQRPGIRELDPSRHGTGLPGAESARKEADPKNWINRTYYGIGVGQPGGYQKEVGLGQVKYTTSVEPGELYDLSRDPDDLFLGIPCTGNIVSCWEKAVQKAGYKGYWVKSSMGLCAAVFEPLPIEKEDNPRAARKADTQGAAKVLRNAGGKKPSPAKLMEHLGQEVDQLTVKEILGHLGYSEVEAHMQSVIILGGSDRTLPTSEFAKRLHREMNR